MLPFFATIALLGPVPIVVSLVRRERIPAMPRQLVAIFAVWLLAATLVGLSDALRSAPLVLAALPVALTGLLALVCRRSLELRGFVASIPLPALSALQTVRIAGGAFFLYAAAGELPAFWAWPVGAWDVAVGATAPVVARWLAQGRAAARPLALFHNILGLADFAVAIPVAVLCLPGPLQLIAVTPSPQALGGFPLILITAVGVPLAIAAHVLSLTRLWRSPA